jgi:hypothetical protein
MSTGKEIRVPLTGHISALAFSPDERKLATGLSNGDLRVWDMAALGAGPKSSARTYSREQVEQWWSALADATPDGYRASWLLAEAADQAMPLLKERLRPISEADPGSVRRLLADLQSNRAATRDRASADLDQLGARVEPEVRRQLASRIAPKLRQALEDFLKILPGDVHFPPPGERLRHLRAVAVLERIGTLEAERLLETLARGLPAAEQTLYAEAALVRLRARNRDFLSAGR